MFDSMLRDALRRYTVKRMKKALDRELAPKAQKSESEPESLDDLSPL
jgi:hypothetical protein